MGTFLPRPGASGGSSGLQALLLAASPTCPGGGGGLCSPAALAQRSPPAPTRNDGELEPGHCAGLLATWRRPGSGPGLESSAWCARPGRDPPREGPPPPTLSRRSPAQLGGRIERSLVRPSAGPRPGVPVGLASWAPGRPQNGRRVSPSFVFRSHKRPGACHGRLRPTAWRPGRCRCQKGWRLRGSPRAQTSHRFRAPGLYSPAPLPSARIQAASGAAARRAVLGRAGRLLAPRGKEEKNRFSVAPGPETSRNAERPPWRSGPELWP